MVFPIGLVFSIVQGLVFPLGLVFSIGQGLVFPIGIGILDRGRRCAYIEVDLGIGILDNDWYSRLRKVISRPGHWGWVGVAVVSVLDFLCTFFIRNW